MKRLLLFFLLIFSTSIVTNAQLGKLNPLKKLKKGDSEQTDKKEDKKSEDKTPDPADANEPVAVEMIKGGWDKHFDGAINFYQLSDAGIFIVASNDALYGLNPEDGKEIWKLTDFKKITEEGFDIIPNSPMAAIVDRGLLTEHAIINTVTGQVICKTKALGMQNVIKRFANAKLGGVLFFGSDKAGKMTLMMVDAATGTKRWEAAKIFDKVSEQICSDAYAVSDDAFLISTTKAIYCIDAKTGTEKWRSEIKTDAPVVSAPQEKGFAAFGSMGKNMNRTKALMATAVSSKFFQVKDASKVYFFNNDNFACFDWNTGKQIWKEELKSPVNNYILDDRGIIVTTNQRGENYGDKKGIAKLASSGNKARMYMFDYATGKQLLQDEIEVAGNVVGYSYDNTMNKMVIATSSDKGKNKIDIIDLESGKQSIKKPMKVDGNIRDIKLVSKGLLYITDNEMNIMDLETGTDSWDKSLKVKSYIVHGFKNDNEAYIASDGNIYHFDVSTSELKKIGDISISGKEGAEGLQFVGNNMAISSSQNILNYDLNGKQNFKIYRPAPGVSTFGKIALGVLAVSSTAMMAANSYEAGRARAGGATYKGTTMSNQAAADSYEQDAENWGAIAVASFQAMGQRFKATKSAGEMQSILTKTGDGENTGVGIEIYDKNTGNKQGAVILKDKKPEYFFDDIGRVVYWKKSDKDFKAIKF